MSISPVAALDASGQATGVMPDLLGEVARRLGLQLQVVDYARPDVASPAAPGLLKVVTDGTCDIVDDDFSPYPAAYDWAYAIYYLAGGWSYIVASGNAAAIEQMSPHGLQPLCGMTVATVGDWAARLIREDSQGSGRECRRLGQGPERQQAFGTNDEALQAVASGSVSAYFTGMFEAGPDVAQHPGQYELADMEMADVEDLNMPQSKKALADGVHAALASMVSDGTYDQILQHWNFQLNELTLGDMKIQTGSPGF